MRWFGVLAVFRDVRELREHVPVPARNSDAVEARIAVVDARITCHGFQVRACRCGDGIESFNIMCSFLLI